MTDTPPADHRRRKKRLLIAAILLLLLTAYLLLLAFIPPRVPPAPVIATRNANGTYTQNTAFSSGIAYDIVRLSTTNNAGTISQATAHSQARLFAKSIGIFPSSSAPIDQQVAFALFEKLKDSGRFDQLAYYPPGVTPPIGQPLPDLFIHIDTEHFTRFDLLFYRSSKARVLATLCDSPVHSPYFNSHVIRVVSLDHQTALSASATQFGIESPGSQHQVLARSIAADITNQIGQFLDSSAKKQGSPVPPPPEFIPAYAPLPNLPFLKTYNAQFISSGPALLKHNYANWILPNQPIDDAFVNAAIADLQALGWNVSPTQFEKQNHVFQASSPDKTQQLRIQWNPRYNIFGSSFSLKDVCRITFAHHMSESEVADALKALLLRNAPEPDLLACYPFWRLQQPLIDEYLALRPPGTPAGLLEQTNGLIAQKRPDDARKALLRAHLFQSLINGRNVGITTPQITALAKTLAITTFPKVPDLSLLSQAERIDIPGDLPAKRTLALGQTIVLVGHADPNRINAICVSVVPHGDPKYPYLYRYKISPITIDSSSSASASEIRGDLTSGAPETLGFLTNTPDQLPFITVTAKPIPNSVNFELTFSAFK